MSAGEEPTILAEEEEQPPPSVVEPTGRDVILGEGSAGHKTNILLQDMMRLHRIAYRLQDKKAPETTEEASEIAQKLFDLIKNGKAYELAGLKDVPKPFMKSQGRFLEKEGDSWNELDDEKAKKALASAMVEEFKVTDDLGDLTVAPYKDWKEMMERPSQAVNNDTDTTDEELIIVPQAKDAILLECVNASTGDKMYEQQGGNKTIFNLASQLVTSYTTTCEKRVEAALILLKGFDEAELHDEDREKLPPAAISKTSRFLVRTLSDDHEVKWAALEGMGPAEFAVTFVFEVFLEKGIHNVVASSLEDIGANLASLPPTDTAKPGTVPVDEPTDYDVLFGRGGMTNSHPGNRRFRDIIALHRPDYIRAIKMDKPGVARKIVKAIRFGSPPGRFLKKSEDGKWYDVGDRTAAEKTSQGLRERSNAEKRQRSALREALRIRKQDIAEPDGTDSNKKQKVDSSAGLAALSASTIPTLNYIGTNLPVPLSLNMKEHTVKKKVEGAAGSTTGELNTEGLPPNAVDEEGNILVSDWDILCGRGGLTNHHKGNKRFRDIVALHRPDYTRAPKIQKPSVARVIVRAIRNGDPPGRFLKKDEKTGRWYDIGDKKAAEKTSQALREKTNEERDKLKGDAASLGVQVLLPNPTSYLAAVSGAPLVLPGMQQPLMVSPTAVSAGVAQNEKEKEEASAAENSQEDSKPAAVEGISAEAVAATAADVAATAAETIANVSDATNDALVAEETSRLVPAVANPVAHSAEVTAQEAVSAAAETTEDIAQAAVAAATAAADEAAKASMEQIETTSV